MNLGEESISKSGNYSSAYALYVLYDRFILGEEVIKQSSHRSVYEKHFGISIITYNPLSLITGDFLFIYMLNLKVKVGKYDKIAKISLLLFLYVLLVLIRKSDFSRP